jgi:CubicO group peptidase (beta-lactamase class C family)
MSSLVDNFDTKRTMVLDSPGFDSYVGKLMREWQVPGLAIAVVDGGKTTVKVIKPH